MAVCYDASVPSTAWSVIQQRRDLRKDAAIARAKATGIWLSSPHGI